MNPFELGKYVIIRRTQSHGQVIGIWDSLFGEPQYLVRYDDTTKRLAEHWLTAGELEIPKAQ